MQTTSSRPIARKLALILIAVLPALLAVIALLMLPPLAVPVTAHEPGYEEKAWTRQITPTIDGTINTSQNFTN